VTQRLRKWGEGAGKKEALNKPPRVLKIFQKKNQENPQRGSNADPRIKEKNELGMRPQGLKSLAK